MAINLVDTYPGRVGPATNNYPQGEPRNNNSGNITKNISAHELACKCRQCSVSGTGSAYVTFRPDNGGSAIVVNGNGVRLFSAGVVGGAR